MDKQIKTIISIIVPVYNTGNYLEQCLDSIVNQTFKDYEVICIDDGSTDNSSNILEKYKKSYDNFKIIYQQNSGVAIARNKAIQLASGDYLVFIDSDDFIKPNYLEKLYKEAISSNSDIVICNFYRYFEKNKISLPVIYKQSKGIYSTEEILKSTIPDNLIHSYLWNKLWKKEIFNDISFPNMKFEDLAIMCKLIHKSTRISVINDTLYYYRIRKTSIVRSYSVSTQNDYIKAYAYIRLLLKEINEFKYYKFYFTLLTIKVFIVMLFANLFLMHEYKSFKLVFKNISNCYKFVTHANSNDFKYNSIDLETLHILEK